jgi:hypothetical protein
MRSTPLYAPDGMAGAGSDRQRFELDAMQAHERYDDGLVHNHNWAVTTNFDAKGILGGTPFTRAFAGSAGTARFHEQDAVQAHERYDDGLVHNHDWAVTGK